MQFKHVCVIFDYFHSQSTLMLPPLLQGKIGELREVVASEKEFLKQYLTRKQNSYLQSGCVRGLGLGLKLHNCDPGVALLYFMGVTKHLQMQL